MSTTTATKLTTAAEKITRTTLDTILVTPELVNKWELPSGQRPLRVGKKVREAAEKIKADGGVIPGVITLGVMDKKLYLIDGQHRRHGFLLSGLQEGYADVRYFHVKSMADINDEFVELNSSLSSMRPDDILRGLETSVAVIQLIRETCPFVGYDMVRRGSTSNATVSMSATLRIWAAACMDTPAPVSISAVDIAKSMPVDECRHLIDFLTLAGKAWGREMEYARLWTGLNLCLCMWLYRKLVMSQYSAKTPRLTKDVFLKCLLSVSADSAYQDWLLGRRMGERDRAPAYSRLKSTFARRLEQELGGKVQLPAPAWSNS